MRRDWWKSKKFWCSMLGGALMAFGHKLGIPPDNARQAGYLLISGAGIEGVLDLAGIFMRRDHPEGSQ